MHNELIVDETWYIASWGDSYKGHWTKQEMIPYDGQSIIGFKVHANDHNTLNFAFLLWKQPTYEQLF